MPHICVSKSSQHWLVAYAAPSHYLNQCWSIGPLSTNFSEIFIRIQNFSFTKIHMNISSAKMRPFCPGEDELMATRRHAPFIFKINPVRESFTVIYIELITLFNAGQRVRFDIFLYNVTSAISPKRIKSFVYFE